MLGPFWDHLNNSATRNSWKKNKKTPFWMLQGRDSLLWPKTTTIVSKTVRAKTQNLGSFTNSLASFQLDLSKIDRFSSTFPKFQHRGLQKHEKAGSKCNLQREQPRNSPSKTIRCHRHGELTQFQNFEIWMIKNCYSKDSADNEPIKAILKFKISSGTDRAWNHKSVRHIFHC